MQVQISENKLTEMYVEIDDLYKAYLKYQYDKGLGKHRKPTRETGLSPSEFCTIMAAYHLSGYKCFEYYYSNSILSEYRNCFPGAPSYERFVALIPRSVELLVLWMLHTCRRAERTGIYFVDSKKMEVCHLRREKSHRVFKGLAKKGKTSTGWFFGLKTHLVVNNMGQIVAFELTQGNVADNNHGLLKRLFNGLEGKCVGDKGYHTTLFDFFFGSGLHLVTKPKKNTKKGKKALVPNWYNTLLDKRAVIESVYDILSTVCDIDHSRHRSPINALAHTVAGLIAYQFMDKKPCVFYPSVEKRNAIAA